MRLLSNPSKPLQLRRLRPLLPLKLLQKKKLKLRQLPQSKVKREKPPLMKVEVEENHSEEEKTKMANSSVVAIAAKIIEETEGVEEDLILQKKLKTVMTGTLKELRPMILEVAAVEEDVVIEENIEVEAEKEAAEVKEPGEETMKAENSEETEAIEEVEVKEVVNVAEEKTRTQKVLQSNPLKQHLL